MNIPMTMSIIFVCGMWSLVGYTYLQSKIPGKGLKVFENIFKETISFDQAIQALQDGNRIRRKSESHGYTKMLVTDGKKQKEQYATYWVRSGNKNLDHCSFTIEEVLASDWIVDN